MVAWEEKGRGAASRGSRDLWGDLWREVCKEQTLPPSLRGVGRACAFTVYWPFDSKGKRDQI